MAPRLSVADGAPVTLIHDVEDTTTLGDFIEKPNVPRAYLAVDREHPNGSPGHEHGGLSVLQQHVAFFDRNKDGIVYPWETYVGFRAVGFNILWSFGGAIVINGAMSYPTLNSWIPNPLFPIIVRNIHKAKHGSDSEVYDIEGRFVPQKFDELFVKYDKGNKGALSFLELLAMTEANRNAVDPFGWTAEKLEWGLTYLLIKDDKGLCSKDHIRGIFDASIFTRLEQERKSHTKKVK